MNTLEIRPIAAKRNTGAVPIGRSTKFGNPYKVTADVTPQTATRLYRLWIWRSEQRDLRNAAWRELRGKRLWCPGCRGHNPGSCHGSVLAEVIDNAAEKLASR